MGASILFTAVMIRAFRHGSLQQWRISLRPCWCACGKNLNIISMCVVSPMVHTSNISSCQKKKLFQFSCGCEQFHYGRSFGFLGINVCNHREHYEMPGINYKSTNVNNLTSKIVVILGIYSNFWQNFYSVNCRWIKSMEHWWNNTDKWTLTYPQ
jgi:hypothetical protein